MRSARIAADVFSYSAAISACTKCQQLLLVLQLLEEMRPASIVADMCSYNAAISACEKDQQ